MSFEKRYPDLAFLLKFFPYEPVEPIQESKILEAHQKWDAPIEELNVIYIIGLDGFALFDAFAPWLEEKKERALVFVEDHLGAFRNFLEYPKSKKCLENKQVHLIYAEEDPIEDLAQVFPTERIGILTLPGKSFDEEALLRRSSALSASISDALYGHQIFKNSLPNLFLLEKSFDPGKWKDAFKDMPIVICGAGPSLEKEFSTLNEIQDKALILAGGSAIPILSQNGIQPHLGIALDPNEEEYDRFKQSTYKGPFLFGSRLHHQVLKDYTGPTGYLKTDTGGQPLNWFEEKLGLDHEAIGPDLGSEAFSVTTLAISFRFLGCNPIILAGVDLGYTNEASYAPGLKLDETARAKNYALDQELIREDMHGKPIRTLLKWVMEADSISSYAKNHPKTTFLNASKGGLRIQNIATVSLKEKLEEIPAIDIHQKIQTLIENHPFLIKSKKIEQLCVDLEESLNRARGYCEQMLDQLEKMEEPYNETGKITLLRFELEEEIAFHCFLEMVDGLLDQLLIHYHPGQDKRKIEQARYQELLKQVGLFTSVLSSRTAYCEASEC